MTKGELTKEKIIKLSAELFLKNGYCNTGLSTILTTCSIPKGSFYFHFKSKDELGAAVANYFSVEYTNWFTDILSNTTDWAGFVERLANDINLKISGNSFHGCPFSSFGTEAAVIDTNIAAICSTAINNFGKQFAEAMYRKTTVTSLELQKGFAALSMYEGYLVCFRITNNSIVIDKMKKSLIDMGVD